MRVQWLSGRVLDLRPRVCGFEPHRRHCIVSLSKNINPSLVLIQPRKTCPFINERFMMGCKESNQTNKTNKQWWIWLCHWNFRAILWEDFNFKIYLKEIFSWSLSTLPTYPVFVVGYSKQLLDTDLPSSLSLLEAWRTTASLGYVCLLIIQVQLPRIQKKALSWKMYI